MTHRRPTRGGGGGGEGYVWRQRDGDGDDAGDDRPCSPTQSLQGLASGEQRPASRAASLLSMAHSLTARLQFPWQLQPSQQQRADAHLHDNHFHERNREHEHLLSLDEEVDGIKSFLRRTRDRRAKSVRQFDGCFDWLAAVLPCVTWLRTYRVKEFLLWDLVAGVSVGFMIVPQGLSYASLAGVPPVFGLYTSFLPLAVYALLGSSRQLGVGPVAVTSLMIGHGLHELVPESSEIETPATPGSPALELVQQRYNQKVVQLALLVAVFYTTVGLLRLGFLMRFLSHAVVTGFTSGAAIIIALSQVPYIFGLRHVRRADALIDQVSALAEASGSFQWQELVMGLSMLFFLLGVRFASQRWPRIKWAAALGPVVACVTAIVVVAAGQLHTRGVIRIVAHIPRGLPQPTVGWWAPIEDTGGLVRLALVVMLVDLLESTSIARALARKNGYALNYNQEVVALGVGNFVGAAFSAYTATGGFSRSAVNNACGAKTQLAGFVTSMVVMCVLLFLTPVFQLLPYNTMAAIIIAGVVTLVEFKTALYLFRTHLRDFVVWLVAFFGTLFLGVELGLGIAVGLAILIAVFESAFPLTAVLGRVRASRVYRDVKQMPDVTLVPGVLVCEFIAPLFFANTQWCEDRLEDYRHEAEALAAKHGRALRFVVIDLTPVSHLDSAGVHFLEQTFEECAERGAQLLLVNPRPRVVHMLRRTGLLARLGDDQVFVHAHDAVVHAERLLLEEEASKLTGTASAVKLSVQSSAAVAAAGEDLSVDVAATPAVRSGDVELAATPSTKC